MHWVSYFGGKIWPFHSENKHTSFFPYKHQIGSIFKSFKPDLYFCIAYVYVGHTNYSIFSNYTCALLLLCNYTMKRQRAVQVLFCSTVAFRLSFVLIISHLYLKVSIEANKVPYELMLITCWGSVIFTEIAATQLEKDKEQWKRRRKANTYHISGGLNDGEL